MSTLESLPGSSKSVLVIPDGGEQGVHNVKRTGFAYRMVANSLPGRAVESTIRTIKSTTKMSYLSPWGDNNPVTLPNVRGRDAIFFGLDFATGGATGLAVSAGALEAPTEYFLTASIAGMVTSTAVNGVLAAVIIEEPTEHILEKRTVHFRQLNSEEVHISLVVVRHKLYNETASLDFFHSPPDLDDPQKYEKSEIDLLAGTSEKGKKTFRQRLEERREKFSRLMEVSPGWYSPYLMATQRLPMIPRTEHPAIVMCYGPFAPGDYLLAHHLTESAYPRLISFCNPEPTTSTPYLRLLVSLVGIKPFRSTWASSRRPDEGRLHYQMPDGVPAIVLPVRAGAPLISWHATTLKDAFDNSSSSDSAREWQIRARQDIFAFLEQVIDWQAVQMPNFSKAVDVYTMLQAAVGLLVASSYALKDNKKVKKTLDLERSGIVFLRYGNQELFKKNGKNWKWKKPEDLEAELEAENKSKWQEKS